MSELDDSFAVLLGRQPTDKEKQDLYRVRDALKLKATDAVWLLLMALQHYETLYRRYPALIAEAAKEVTEGRPRDGRLAQARAAAADTTKALAQCGGGSSDRVGEESSRSAAVEVGDGLLPERRSYASRRSAGGRTGAGERTGYAIGYEAARNKYENAAAMASWANTPDGRLAYGLAKGGSLRELATCSGRGWVQREGMCYPSSKTHGWRLPADAADQ